MYGLHPGGIVILTDPIPVTVLRRSGLFVIVEEASHHRNWMHSQNSWSLFINPTPYVMHTLIYRSMIRKSSYI